MNVIRRLCTCCLRGSRSGQEIEFNSIPLRTFNGVTATAHVTEVYDGDTITIVTRIDEREPLYRYKFRLYGLDAPEMKPRLIDPNRLIHKAAGVAVRDVLRKIILGKTIRIECVKEDKYGRLMGTIYYDAFDPEKSVNQWLIDEELVLPYDGGTKTDFTKELLQQIIVNAEKQLHTMN